MKQPEFRKRKNSKLSIKDDIRICELYSSGEFNSVQLGKIYSVSSVSIRKILRKYNISIRRRYQIGESNHMFGVRGKLHHSWKGGVIHRNGYKMIKSNHPKNINGYYYEHRIIVETQIGRILEFNETINHKDGNKLNNDINNLEILGRSEHLRMHNLERIRNEKGQFQRQL